MSKKRKWSSEAKFKIALEVIKGDMTLGSNVMNHPTH